MMRGASALITLAILSVVMLAGCGFQLRNDRLPERIDTPIQIIPAKSAIGAQLAKSMRKQHIEVVDQAFWQISLEHERREKRPIALTSRATTAEYRLSHRVWVSLRNRDEVVFPPTLIEATRTLVVRPTEAAGMEQEEQLLLRELEQEIIDRILRWLSFSLRDSPLVEKP